MMLGFPKSSRIRHRRDFTETMDHGLKAVCAHLVLFGRARTEGTGPRLGLVVSRKVGIAVVRNRVKRRLRESYRHIQPELGLDLDIVVVARPSAANLDADETREALKNCLARLAKQAQRGK